MSEIIDSGKTILFIKSHLTSLTKAEYKAAQYIIEHASEVIYHSVTELAEKAGVGETTVLRLCRKMKFQGFQDFKLSLAKDQVHPSKYFQTEVHENDDAIALTQKIIATNIQTLENTKNLTDSVPLDKAISLLCAASRIQFFGAGSSGLTAIQAAQLFTRIGKFCTAQLDPHFQAMEASLLDENSVAVGISISGSTKDTIENMRLAKKAGAKVIVITSNARSPITKYADIVLLSVAKENPLQGSSMSAKISQLCIIDILNVGVSLKSKENAQKYRELTAKAISDKLM